MAEHRVTSFILLYVSVTDSENATNRTSSWFGLKLHDRLSIENPVFQGTLIEMLL